MVYMLKEKIGATVAMVFLILVVGSIGYALMSSALNPETCVECRQKCAAKYRLNIDDKWIECELECARKHSTEECFNVNPENAD